MSARVFRTGRPARMEGYDNVEGALAARVRELGPRSRAGAPIIVDEKVWGVALVGASAPAELPSDIEERIVEFADLAATAIANTATRSQLHASQDELRRLAEQQAALRRVATLVAHGTSPVDLFAVVAEEVARIVDVPLRSSCATTPTTPQPTAHLPARICDIHGRHALATGRHERKVAGAGQFRACPHRRLLAAGR